MRTDPRLTQIMLPPSVIMAGDGLKAPQLSVKDIEMDDFPEVDEAALPAQCETVAFAHSVRDTTAFRYPYITGGYRRAPSTVRECAASTICLHNETINIWTHILGAAIFVYLFVHVLVVSSRKSSTSLHQEEQAGGISGGGFAVISVYIFSGVICFTLSALYHTFASADERVVRNFEKADHIGVLLLMLGSNLPMIYFGFVEHTHFIVLHTSMSVCAIILAIGALEFDQMRKRKLYIFVAVAAVGWAQLIHDLSLRGAFWSPESRAAVLVRLCVLPYV